MLGFLFSGRRSWQKVVRQGLAQLRSWCQKPDHWPGCLPDEPSRIGRVDRNCLHGRAMGTLEFPRTDPQNRSLRSWIGAPLQLLTAQQAQGAPLMAHLSSVEEGGSVGVSMAHDAASAAALHRGQSVTALVYTGTEIMQFRSTVVQAQAEPADLLRLAFPTEIRFHRLRREHRIPACIPAVVAGVDGLEVDATLIDFSPSGCHLACSNRIGELGEKVRLQFAVPVGGEPEAQMAIVGEVRWINPLAADEVAHYACGIRFEAPAQDLARIEQLVASFRLAAGHASSIARP
ncbi:MAG: flagellar brake protein [Burkholderiaceae bacterium]|nr:flagellar brake protein [Burkholderiaceae bacterium]